MIRAAQAKHDQQLIDKFNANPKALYGYMMDRSGLKHNIRQLTCIKTDGTLTKSDGEAAEALNNFFHSESVTCTVLLIFPCLLLINLIMYNRS